MFSELLQESEQELREVAERRLDILAHATAVGQKLGPVVEIAPEEWDRVMSINAKGAFLLSTSAARHLTRPGGAIVFTGPYTGLAGQVHRAAYCASKGALHLFTQTLAIELAEEGIRVNGVAPAMVESELGRRGLEQIARRDGISVEEAAALRDARISLRRQAEAEEVADAFVYLAGAKGELRHRHVAGHQRREAAPVTARRGSASAWLANRGANRRAEAGVTTPGRSPTMREGGACR